MKNEKKFSFDKYLAVTECDNTLPRAFLYICVQSRGVHRYFIYTKLFPKIHYSFLGQST